jgi:hypothetical protein
MKSLIVIGLFGLALSAVACGGADTSAPSSTISSADRLVLDVRCASNADCPATFECELESEHGAPTSFCKSHDPIGSASSPSCPAGTEAEVEHGTTFCKAHGGAASGGGGGAASSGGGGAASGGGGGAASGGGGADDDAGPSTSGGGAAAGATCATSADCAPGLECEVQVELGVTTSTCNAHGGKK